MKWGDSFGARRCGCGEEVRGASSIRIRSHMEESHGSWTLQEFGCDGQRKSGKIESVCKESKQFKEGQMYMGSCPATRL